jgi:hypothetical protein
MQGISMFIEMRAKGKRSCESLPIQGLTMMCKEECVRGQRRQKEEFNQKPENGSGKEEEEG